MSLNWKEIDLILNELPLTGCSVQKIRQPDFRTLVLDLYFPKNRYSLLISLAQGKTRLHSISRPVRNQVRLQRFAQMLRARIQGGRITAASQVGQERIVRLDILRAGEHTVLFIRLWGGAANILATDQEYRIIDAFYRRPKRDEVSGNVFDPSALIEKAAGKSLRPAKEFSVRAFPSDVSFNNFIEMEYFHKEQQEELNLLERKFSAMAEQQTGHLELKLEELNREASFGDESDIYKQIGDILMANLYAIPPKSNSIQLEDFYHEGNMIEIELDPGLSPQRNAEQYYNRYRKGHRRQEHIDDEIRNLRESLNSFKKETGRISSIQDPAEKIGALKDFLSAYRPVKGVEKKQAVPGLRFSSGPFVILVGRTAKENDALLRHFVRGNDYWLHTRDFPGGYVFIKYISGKSIPLETLLDAGNLALHYSKARASGKAELYYTQVKYLRRAKDAKTGLVLPTHEKNLSIQLDEKRIERLFHEK